MRRREFLEFMVGASAFATTFPFVAAPLVPPPTVRIPRAYMTTLVTWDMQADDAFDFRRECLDDALEAFRYLDARYFEPSPALARIPVSYRILDPRFMKKSDPEYDWEDRRRALTRIVFERESAEVRVRQLYAIA